MYELGSTAPAPEAAPVFSAPLEALWEVYPMTLSRLDDAASLQLVIDFYEWRKTSPRGTLARQFPIFLVTREWPAEHGFLPSLAEAEWMIFDIQQDPELPGEGFERITTASDDDWEKAQLRLDPGHRILRSEWCLTDIFKDLAGAHEPKPGTFLIYRLRGRPKVRALKENEAALIEALGTGESLGAIQDRPDGPEFDAFLFQRWVETGLLRAIHWASA